MAGCSHLIRVIYFHKTAEDIFGKKYWVERNHKASWFLFWWQVCCWALTTWAKNELSPIQQTYLLEASRRNSKPSCSTTAQQLAGLGHATEPNKLTSTVQPVKVAYMNTGSRNVANARNSAQGLKELEQPSCPLTAVNSAAAAGKWVPWEFWK